MTYQQFPLDELKSLYPNPKNNVSIICRDISTDDRFAQYFRSGDILDAVEKVDRTRRRLAILDSKAKHLGFASLSEMLTHLEVKNET